MDQFPRPRSFEHPITFEQPGEQDLFFPRSRQAFLSAGAAFAISLVAAELYKKGHRIHKS
jgi:hypothetical protein